MRVTINGTYVLRDDDAIQPVAMGVPVMPELSDEQRKLWERIMPEFFGVVGVTSVLAVAYPRLVMAADASARLIAKEESIIHTLQSIATPAAIAIAIWGLIEWAVMNNPHGKKKIWESLWLLIGIKFIPDIWMTIAA